MKIIKQSLLLILVFFGCKKDGNTELDTLKAQKSSKFIFISNFESGKVTDGGWSPAYDFTKTYAATIVKKPVHSGKNAIRFELHKTDEYVAGSLRSQLELMPPEAPLQERWYGLNIYLPKGTEKYEKDSSAEVIAQWHSVADPGEYATVPALRLMTYKGIYWLGRHWDSKKISTDKNENSIEEGFDNKAYQSYLGDLGKWTNWVFHIRWGWEISQSPLIEIYKNGVLVYSRINKPNTTNDDEGIFFVIGVYKSDWAENTNSILSKRVIYYDDIFIGDKTCKLSDF
jgi:hypothetical protein